MNQFEFPLGDEDPEAKAKREKMEAAAERYPWLLKVARMHARRLARANTITDIEEVREAMEKEGTFPFGATREELNWMGSTFTTGEFYRCGDRPAWHQHSNGRRVLRSGPANKPLASQNRRNHPTLRKACQNAVATQIKQASHESIEPSNVCQRAND